MAAQSRFSDGRLGAPQPGPGWAPELGEPPADASFRPVEPKVPAIYVPKPVAKRAAATDLPAPDDMPPPLAEFEPEAAADASQPVAQAEPAETMPAPVTSLTAPLEPRRAPVAPQGGAQLVAGLRRKLRVPAALTARDADLAQLPVDELAPLERTLTEPVPINDWPAEQHAWHNLASAGAPERGETGAVRSEPLVYWQDGAEPNGSELGEVGMVDAADLAVPAPALLNQNNLLLGGILAATAVIVLTTTAIFLWPETSVAVAKAPLIDRPFVVDVTCPGMERPQAVKLSVPDETAARWVVGRDLPGCSIDRVAAGG